LWEDPIVEEVRKIRKEQSERFDFDLDKIFQNLKQQEKKSGKRYASYPPKILESVAGGMPDADESKV
jgi:hypothetical protein